MYYRISDNSVGRKNNDRYLQALSIFYVLNLSIFKPLIKMNRKSILKN